MKARLFLCHRYNIDYPPSMVTGVLHFAADTEKDLWVSIMEHLLLFQSEWCDKCVQCMGVIFMMSTVHPWHFLWSNCWTLYSNSFSLVFNIVNIRIISLRVPIRKMRLATVFMPAWHKYPWKRRLIYYFKMVICKWSREVNTQKRGYGIIYRK